jgi:serine/threonine protein phosphatase PrpC
MSDPSATASWHIAGASVMGTSHQHMMPPRGCDDVCSWQYLPESSLVIAVADGAGSASHAAEGATEAVQSAMDVAKDAVTRAQIPTDHETWNNMLHALLSTAQKRIGALACFPLTPGDYATTLLTVVITPLWLAALQVGDGAIILRYNDERIEAATWPTKGEFVNETTFITSSRAHDDAQIIIMPSTEIRGVALMTDGIELISLDMTNHIASAPFFAPFFALMDAEGTSSEKEATIRSFLQSERVNGRTDDDKTLVLATRRKES